MTRHGSLNSSTVHPSGGSPAESSAPRCCARCRRGTPATGIGECGYLLDCPNDCHNVKADREYSSIMLERAFGSANEQ